jgi:chromosome segregation ATPase
MKKYLLILTSLATTTIAFSQQVSLTNFNTEVFIENFSSNSTQFSYETTSENYFIVDDGDLFLSRNNKLSDFTIFSEMPFSEENYKLKASIKLMPTNNKKSHVGILLNTQLDGNGLISIELNTKKEYRIRQINKGESKYLSGNRDKEGWISSNQIKNNGEYNYIDILCYNGRYDLYFNFQYINTFESPEYTSGRFGFIIGAESQARIDYIHIHKEGGKVSTVDFNNANDKILKLETEVLNLQKTIDSDKELIQQLKVEKNDITLKLEKEKKTQTTLIQDKENLELKIKNLDGKLKEANSSKNKIISESGDFKKAILSYEKISTNLKEKNDKLLNQLDSKINELSKLQTDLSNSTSELNKKTIDVSRLNTELKDLKEQLENINASNSNLKNSNSKYESETLELNRKIVNQENQLNKLNAEIKTLSDQNTSITSKITTLTNSKNNLDTEKKELARKIVNQENKLNKLNAEIKTLSDQNTSITSQIKALKNSKSSLSEEKIELNRKIVNQSNQIKAQELKISDLNAKINSLANQKEKANTQLKKANSQIIELTSKITNLNSKIATNQKKIISQESQISNLDNQLKNSSKKNLKDRETITLLNSKNKILNDSISKLFTNNTALLIKEKELNDLQIKFNNLTKDNELNVRNLKLISSENQKLN